MRTSIAPVERGAFTGTGPEVAAMMATTSAVADMTTEAHTPRATKRDGPAGRVVEVVEVVEVGSVMPGVCRLVTQSFPSYVGSP